MSQKIRHVLGISGGKDSAALAIYMHNKYPQMDMEYYCCDTGKELDETYQLIDRLETYLGKPIQRLSILQSSEDNPFDHFLKIKGGFLPATFARWCTRKMKLEPFERYVGNDQVVSYVGIRGDEDREGYISKKSNIQSIFPFRQNIWSEDVIRKVLANNNIASLVKSYQRLESSAKFAAILPYLETPLSFGFALEDKLKALLDANTAVFNQVVFGYLQSTAYPLGKVEVGDFPIVDNTDILIRQDIFDILEESGIGTPAYYKKIAYSVNGKVGQYARSRSGCFFCFFQQKIEWVWLYEQHPHLFQQAMDYEKEGYTWNQQESLTELIEPERIKQIKQEHLVKEQKRKAAKQSPFLLDILEEAEGEGCAACFI